MARPAAKWLQDNIKKEQSQYAKDVLAEIKGSKIYLDESQKQEAAKISESYNAFRKSMIGNIIFSDNANTSLDSKWQEWSSVFPDLFDSDISSNDMPGQLVNISQKQAKYFVK